MKKHQIDAQEVLLADLCYPDQIGQYGIPAAGEPYTKDKNRYLRITDISDDGLLLDTDKKGVSGEIDERYFLSEGDVVFARTGNSTGRSYLYDKNDGRLVYAGFLIKYKLDPTKVNPRYIHYFTQSAYYKAWVKNLSGGSTRGNISATTFAECPIYLPDRIRQDYLVNVLSVIDCKIALNRKRIATLEAMAKEIYDYWFVQFDFLDAHGRPYKSSGGAMVYNPDLKREIPKGWEVRPLGEVAEVVNGATPSTTNPKNYDGDIVWITPKDLSDQRSKFTYGGSRTISREGYDSCSTHMLPRGSILMSSRAPIGLLSIAAVDLCTNQGFKSFVPKEIDDNLYLYYYLKEHMAQIEAMGSGTTFKEVSRESMISFPIPYESDRRAYASFVAIVKPIFNQQELLVKELARLSALRDFLLPVLMNGQVKVR